MGHRHCNSHIDPKLPCRPHNSHIDPKLPCRPHNSHIDPKLPCRPHNSHIDPKLPCRPQNSHLDPKLPSRPQNSHIDPKLPCRPQNSHIDPKLPCRPHNNHIDPKLPCRPHNSHKIATPHSVLWKLSCVSSYGMVLYLNVWPPHFVFVLFLVLNTENSSQWLTMTNTPPPPKKKRRRRKVSMLFLQWQLYLKFSKFFQNRKENVKIRTYLQWLTQFLLVIKHVINQ